MSTALRRGRMALMVALLSAGCSRAYLAADSFSIQPGVFVETQPQYVHVGEKVTFDLRVKPAVDDYAVFQWPDGGDELVMANPSVQGYRVSRTFAQLGRVTAKASAYQVRGLRDVEQVAGQMISRAAPDARDRKLGTASVALVIYQSHVTIVLPKGGGEPDWSRTTLRLLPAGAKPVDVSHRVGDQAGYDVAPGAASRFWAVTYRPTAGQVSRGGTTAAELRVTYADGRTEVVRHEFPTP